MRRGIGLAIAGLLLAGCTSASSSGQASHERPTGDRVTQTPDPAAAAQLAAESKAAEKVARRYRREQRAPTYVYYYLAGSAVNATITYQKPSGGSGQETVAVTHAFGPAIRVRAHAGDFVYFSAQNEGESGTLTCKIVEQDGFGKRVLNRNTSSGAYAIVECDSTVR